MIYCDTSFLVSLYVEKDVNNAIASRAAAKFSEAIPLTFLCELELTNSLRRLTVSGRLSEAELAATLSQIERDIADGFLVRQGINQAAQYKLAQEISKRRMSLLARSLDILHVSAALLLSAKDFASFDTRQRTLVKAEGLRLMPARIS